VARHDGDHHFLVQTCNRVRGSTAGSTGGTYEWPVSRWSPVVRLTLWDQTGWTALTALDWNGLTNMPW